MKRAAFLLALAAATPAAAQDAALDLETAQTRLQARLTASEAPLPLASVPADAALLRAANDVKALRAIDVDDLDGLSRRCAGPGTWGLYYMTRNPAPDLRQAVAALAAPTTAENIVRYQDELAMIFPATVACSMRVSLALSRSLMRLPAEQRANAPGLSTVRDGMINLLVGNFQTQADPGIRPANAASMLSQLAIDPADSLLLLSAPQRSQVREELDRAIKTPGVANRAALEAFAKVMDTTPCTDICLVP